MNSPEQSTAEQVEQVRTVRAAKRAARLFTITEAAEWAGVSRSRIRRLLDAGAFPSAVRDDAPQGEPNPHPWRIPHGDLVAAGLTPRTDPIRSWDRGEQPREQAEQSGEQHADRRLSDLSRELEVERERRRAAEALAAERGRALDNLERAMRLLEAANPQPTETPASPPRETRETPALPAAEKARRRWWPWGSTKDSAAA